MTRPSSDHWQTGDVDLERRARQLSAAHVDADVVLVQLYRDLGAAADPEQDDRVLSALWRAATETATGDLDGRRLSWRSFVLLMRGDSTVVRKAITEASRHIHGTPGADSWHVSVHWVGSSGDFIDDVKDLETRAGLDR